MAKDLTRSETILGDPRDAAVSAVLVKINREDTETLGEEGIDSRQKGPTQSLEDIRQSLSMKRTLDDCMTVMEATTEKDNEAAKKKDLERRYHESRPNIDQKQIRSPGDSL